jgi:hypothetical protein
MATGMKVFILIYSQSLPAMQTYSLVRILLTGTIGIVSFTAIILRAEPAKMLMT